MNNQELPPLPEPDERAVFEAWYEGKPAQHMAACWNAWVARAALAAAPAPETATALRLSREVLRSLTFKDSKVEAALAAIAKALNSIPSQGTER